MECNPLTEIVLELKRAKAKHPYFPDDPIHAAAILGEESGELTQAALDFVYSGGDLKRLKEEASQCGAMAIRFLENLNRYEEWKKRKPDTVEFITYDGTPETLPKKMEMVLIYGGVAVLSDRRGHSLVWDFDDRAAVKVQTGDRWAYLPTPGNKEDF